MTLLSPQATQEAIRNGKADPYGCPYPPVHPLLYPYYNNTALGGSGFCHAQTD
jgi:hypothetical protein